MMDKMVEKHSQKTQLTKRHNYIAQFLKKPIKYYRIIANFMENVMKKTWKKY